jgi:hypothetical protein
MNAAPRLWTDVVSGAFGFAAFGLLSEATAPDFGEDEPAFTFWNAGAAFAATCVLAAGLACATVAVFAGFSATAGFWFDHDAPGFTVLSATVPTVFADDDEDATTWRKNQPGFARRGGDFGVTAATFGAGPAAFAVVVAFWGAVFVAFAPLDITGGVTVVFAMRSENVAAVGLDVVDGFAAVVAFGVAGGWAVSVFE